MQYRISSTLIALALCTPAAFAQTQAFEGPTVAMNLGLYSNTTELSSGTDRLNGLGATTQGANIQGAWGWVVSPSWVFSVGGSYNLNDQSAGEISGTGGGLNVKRKNAWSIYVEPGIKVSEQTLVYAKVGYENATLRAEGAGSSSEKSMDGAGYGLGIRTMLDKNLYLQAELKQLFYSSATFAGQATDFKTQATEGLFGIGYQF
jgi:outer membrane immunogenic protein